ncbi:MAG: hypothetical protein FWF69_07025 [Firmicutes bacterium]|nr:hypothetical protein [Bacillota bacterium]
MHKLLNTIIQKASWKKSVLFSVLFVVLYAIINRSGMGVAGLLKITGGANILDFEFGYSSEKAYTLLTALGAEGRSFYLTKILPLDFPFPFAYMLFYVGWIALFIKRVPAVKEWNEYLLLIPVLTFLFDWAENISIIAMLNHYPTLTSWVVFLASIFGMLKMILTIGSISIMIVLLAVSIFNSFQPKQIPNP